MPNTYDDIMAQKQERWKLAAERRALLESNKNEHGDYNQAFLDEIGLEREPTPAWEAYYIKTGRV